MSTQLNQLEGLLMKRLIILTALAAFLSGCAWIGSRDRGAAQEGGIPGADLGPGRGTTGVSSGADSGAGITGSDAAPR
jgi:hypothetical protein